MEFNTVAVDSNWRELTPSECTAVCGGKNPAIGQMVEAVAFCIGVIAKLFYIRKRKEWCLSSSREEAICR